MNVKAIAKNYKFISLFNNYIKLKAMGKQKKLHNNLIISFKKLNIKVKNSWRNDKNNKRLN